MAARGNGAYGLGKAWQFLPVTLPRCATVLVLALTMVRSVTAVDSTNASAWAEDWLVRSWQTKDGLPQNSVNAIVQTRDGYLWVGTSGGLARFDGVRFRTFGLQDGLRSVRIATLLEDRRGVLWVGTTGGGVSRWENGRLTALAEAEGFSGADVEALAADQDGTLWVGTERGLLKWSRGAFTRIGPADGLPAKQIRALLLDSRGVLWVSVLLEGLYQGTNGRFAPVQGTPSTPSSAYALFEDREGSIWAGGTGSLWQYQKAGWQRYTQTNGLPMNVLESLAQGTQGALWVGARNSGLYSLSEGSFQRLMGGAVLLEDSIRALCVDREGTLWLGTVGGGLCRLSRRMLHHWGAGEGLLAPSVTSVAEDAAGGLWVATQNGGPWRFEGRRFGKPNDPVVSGKYTHVYSGLGAEDGSVWMAGDQFLLRLRAGQTTQAYLEPPVRGDAIRALCADGTNLWLGTYYSALLKFDGTEIRVAATNGTFGGHITSLAREAPGVLWIGSASGLHRWERGNVRTWTTHDGLLSANIQTLHRDSDGTLWIGTLGGGLARMKHGRIVSVTTRQGLIDDSILQIVPDDLNHLWLGCNHGIMRLERRELDNVAEGSASYVHPLALGQDDGMLTEQCTFGHSPTALKTKDGRLIFPTLRGIVEIDPGRWQEFPATIPQASIEEVLVDAEPQNPASSYVMAPGKRRLEVTYTAPSLRGGDWVRFRFRLEPLDKDWENAGTRRTAFYPNLRPGRYVFRVVASDNRGAWNGSAASVEIVVKPHFWQTLWCRFLLAGILGTAAFAGYKQRIARLERLRTAQETFARQIILSQENERKRVASELHDGLSQNLALLAVELEMFGQRPPVAPSQLNARLREFSAQTKELSADVHRISHGLHPAKLSQLGLVVALKGFCREVDAAHQITVHFAAQGVPRGLPDDVALCLYRVAQEAIQNVVKHSGAESVTVALMTVDNVIELSVTDEGKGFELGADWTTGSLGLVGMSERVRLVHGQFQIESQPGKGTRMTVRIPVPEGTKR